MKAGWWHHDVLSSSAASGPVQLTMLAGAITLNINVKLVKNVFEENPPFRETKSEDRT